MKLEVYLVEDETSRRLVLDEPNYSPSVRGGLTSLMQEVSDFVLRKVVAAYFKDGFSLSRSRINASNGVVRQRLNCGGRNILLRAEGGIMVPYEDHSSSCREFEIVVRLDADSIYLKPMAGLSLKRVVIDNLRSINHIELSISETSNMLLLAGLNGSGKTSILEGIMHAFLKSDRKNAIRPLPDQDYLITIDFTANGGTNYRIEKTPKTHKLFDGTGNLLADTEYEFRRLFAEVGMLFVPSWRSPWLMERGYKRHPRNYLRPTDEDPINSLRMLCVSEFINSRLKPEVPLMGYLEILNTCWHRFYPEQDGGFVIDEDTRERSAVSPGELTLDVFLRRTKKGAPIILSELSSGELEILSLAAQIMVSKNKYDVILIDEPELHLNRIWHAQMVDMITKMAEGCQSIMATHAPEIWNAVYSWERVFLNDRKEMSNA